MTQLKIYKINKTTFAKGLSYTFNNPINGNPLYPLTDETRFYSVMSTYTNVFFVTLKSDGLTLAFWFINYSTDLYTDTVPGFQYINTATIVSYKYSYSASKDIIVVVFIQDGSPQALRYLVYRFVSQTSLTLLYSGVLYTGSGLSSISHFKIMGNFLVICTTSLMRTFVLDPTNWTSLEMASAGLSGVVHDVLDYYPYNDTAVELYLYIENGISLAGKVKSNNCMFYYSNESGTAYCRLECPATAHTFKASCIFCSLPNPYYYNGNCYANCSSTPNMYFDSNNNCVSVCPPSAQYANPDNSCTASCASQNSFINSSNCVSSCSSPNNYIDYDGKTCVSSCPVYISQSNACVNTCNVAPYVFIENNMCTNSCSPSNPKSVKATGLCVTSCPGSDPYLDNGQECIPNCVSPRPYISSNQCVNTCPPSNPYLDNSKNCLPACVAPRPYVYNNQCVNMCPPGAPYLDNNTNCLPDCVSPRPYISNNQCVATCDPSKPYLDNNKNCLDDCVAPRPLIYNNQCIATCNPSKPYTLSGKSCVDTCPFYANYASTSQTCETQCSIGQSWYTNGSQKMCTDTCPNSLSYKIDGTDECVNNCPTGTFSYKNVCYTACPSGTFRFNNACLDSCKSIGKYGLKGVCITKCPDSMVYDNDNLCVDSNCKSEQIVDNNKCTYCSEFDPPKYYYSNSCLATCPDTYLPSTNNACKTCQSLGKYVYKNVCYNTCPSGLVQNSTLYICVNCADKGMVMYNNSCISSCPDGYTLNSQNTCQQNSNSNSGTTNGNPNQAGNSNNSTSSSTSSTPVEQIVELIKNGQTLNSTALDILNSYISKLKYNILEANIVNVTADQLPILTAIIDASLEYATAQ